MSSFYKKTKHPVTGSIENALWVDDHFGRHKYGVEFPDGSVFPEQEIESKEETMPAERDNTCSIHRSNIPEIKPDEPKPLAVLVSELFDVPVRLNMAVWNAMDLSTKRQLICDIVHVGPK